jgi:hypothetical protein
MLQVWQAVLVEAEEVAEVVEEAVSEGLSAVLLSVH